MNTKTALSVSLPLLAFGGVTLVLKQFKAHKSEPKHHNIILIMTDDIPFRHSVVMVVS
jgi:hypothetical protein